MNELIDRFDACLGDAPGGHVRAFQFWIEIATALPQEYNWDRAAAGLLLNRRGWIALLRYAVAKQDWSLAMTVAICGAHEEGRWGKPLTSPIMLGYGDEHEAN